MQKLLQNFVKALPRTCLLCHAQADAVNLCSLCVGDLTELSDGCQLCARPMSIVQSTVCGPCLVRPPPWHNILCLFAYEPPIDTLVKQLKFQANLSAGNTLGTMMSRFIQTHNQHDVDVMVPVAMHWRRYWRRGFNQALELAKPISRQLAIPIRSHYLKRVRHTVEQTQLKTSKRHANVRRAFSAPQQVKDLRIALVDDVITTGATITAATETLLSAGAKSVVVWGCARTLDIK